MIIAVIYVKADCSLLIPSQYENNLCTFQKYIDSQKLKGEYCFFSTSGAIAIVPIKCSTRL